MKRFKNLSLKSKISWFLVCVFIAIWVIINVYPFIFMVLNSFKGQLEILANGVFSLPQSFNLDNFKEVFNNGILHYFFNSILVCTVSLVITLLVAALAAYPIARLHSKIGKFFLLLVLACMSIPEHITLIPIFKFSISKDATTGSFLQISGSFLQILNNTKRGGILPDTASRLCRKPAMSVSYISFTICLLQDSLNPSFRSFDTSHLDSGQSIIKFLGYRSHFFHSTWN